MGLKKKASKKWILVIIIVLFIITLYIIFDSAIRPAVFSLAEIKLKGIASNAVGNAVEETFGSGISYSDFINIEKDETGNIKMITVNSVNVNNFSSMVSQEIQDEITNTGQQGIDIPIGTIIGGSLFSGKGPSINVGIDPAGYVNTHFLTSFESAGINQTRHKIFLVVYVSMKIVISNEVRQVDYSSQQLIADTVIVGEIPEQYMQLDSLGGMQNITPKLLMDQYSESSNTQ